MIAFSVTPLTRCESAISIDDGNDNVLAAAKIKFTDVQEGEWRFYLTDNTLLLPTEY